MNKQHNPQQIQTASNKLREVYTFDQEVYSKPVGQQGQAIINRLERIMSEATDLLNRKEV